MNVSLVVCAMLLGLSSAASAGIDSPFDRGFGSKEYHAGADRQIGAERGGQRHETERSDGTVSTGYATQGPVVPAFGEAFKDTTIVKSDSQIKAEAAKAEADKQSAVAEVEAEQVEALKELQAQDKAAGVAAAKVEKEHLDALSGQTSSKAYLDLAKSTGKAAIAVRAGKEDKIAKATVGVVKSLDGVSDAATAESDAVVAVEDGSLNAAHQQASASARNEGKYAELLAKQEKEAADAKAKADQASAQAAQAQTAQASSRD